MSRWLSVLTLLLGYCTASCQPPSASDPSTAEGDGLPGVDTSALTRGERELWSELVSEQLAPCANVPSSLADCVRTQAPCPACRPAASLLARQIQRGKSKAQAEQIFKTRFAQNQLLEVDPSGSPSKGPEGAPITIVEWADFECAFCQRAAPVLAEQGTRLKDRIRFVFKHFPIAKHPHAVAMAKFAIAAENQGKFWDAYERLFAGEGGAWDAAAIEAMSVKLGLDPKKVVEDMASPETEKRLGRDREQADRLGLKGTPFIIINRRKFDFELFDLDEDLADWLDTELELSESGGAKR
jgi:protein-disulfide isomerase